MKIERAVMEDLDEIVRILDEATLKLLEEGMHQWGYPWYKKEIEKELEYQYVIRQQKRIIAVFSIKPLELNYFEIEPGERDYYLYRVMTAPEYQGKNIGKEIIAFVKTLCRKDKITIYLDCYAGNEKLKKFYKKEGFYELGEYYGKDYRISAYRFHWKDTSFKNHIKNVTKKRKSEIRLFRRAAIAILVVVLLFNVRSVILLFDHRIPLTPAIMVEDYTYWEDSEKAMDTVSKTLESVGKVEKIVDKGRWPSHPMEAGGVPKSMLGEKVYQSYDKNTVYVYDQKRLKYRAFAREFTVKNNNYSNGFYDELLKKCAPEGTVPLDKIPEDYSFDQAKKDKLAIMYYTDTQIKAENSEYMDAFLEDAQKKGKAYVRVTQMLNMGIETQGTTIQQGNLYLDLFYYEKNYYLFVSRDPNMNNARFNYLVQGEIPYSNGRTSYISYILCQDNKQTAYQYLMSQQAGNIMVVFIDVQEKKTTE